MRIKVPNPRGLESIKTNGYWQKEIKCNYKKANKDIMSKYPMAPKTFKKFLVYELGIDQSETIFFFLSKWVLDPHPLPPAKSVKVYIAYY